MAAPRFAICSLSLCGSIEGRPLLLKYADDSRTT